MEKKGSYLKILFGLVSMVCMLILTGGKVKAAEEFTAEDLYNMYPDIIELSPDRQAWTIPGVPGSAQSLEKGYRIDTGIASTLRELEEGEHYYPVKRSTAVPVGYWEVKFPNSFCYHYHDEWEDFHGLEIGSICYGRYDNGWYAYCADCGREIADMFIYAHSDDIRNITVLPGVAHHYYLCPLSGSLEQGTGYKHLCDKISFNRYRVQYLKNMPEDAIVYGTMGETYHMYNNETIYRGGAATYTDTKLRKNSYTCTGYKFIGWNTEEDGSGTWFSDGQDVLNLSTENNARVPLYAQWQLVESTLQIDADGGTYEGEDVFSVTKKYNEKYFLLSSSVEAPVGYEITFEENGGSDCEDITTTKSFSHWQPVGAFGGKLKNNWYTFASEVDGHVDTVKVMYKNNTIVLPTPEKENISFAGWYYDEYFTDYCGQAGDEVPFNEDTTLYAKWVSLALYSYDNYMANDGKGAVNLRWEQKDNLDKIYRIYQFADTDFIKRLENVPLRDVNNVLAEEDWKVIADAGTTAEAAAVNKTLAYKAGGEIYEIQSTGYYELSALGGAGGTYGGDVSANDVSGGNGGEVRATYWLKKGDIITAYAGTKADGAQGGVNGNGMDGGTADGYMGGGAGSEIYITRDGVTSLLLAAGGGGGATDATKGGAGGSDELLRTDGEQKGMEGAAGGGGGYTGGIAGKRHEHTDTCYEIYSEDINLASYPYSTSTWGGHSSTKTATSAYYHTASDDFGASFLHGSMKYNNLQSYGSGIPTDDCTTLQVNLAGHAWGDDTCSIIPSSSYVRVFNQNGEIIKTITLSEAQMDSSAVEGEVWEDDSGWHGTVTTSDYSATLYFQLPEGTTAVYVYTYLPRYNGSCWITDTISMTLKKRDKICGYDENLAQASGGGSNYINTDYGCKDHTSHAGVNAGDGRITISSKDIGYRDNNELTGVTATDKAAPDAVSTKAGKVTFTVVENDETRIKVAWEEPEDNGTDYYHKAESHFADTAERISISNVTKNTLTSGVVGYYYVLDQTENTVVTLVNGTYTSSRAVEVPLTTYTQYLHLAAVDKAGNLSSTSTIELTKETMATNWSLYTMQMEIAGAAGDSTVTGIYPGTEDKTWYVRSDGKTPVSLSFRSYIKGDARTDYQINQSIFEEKVMGETVERRNIIETPMYAISAEDITTTGSSLGDFSDDDMLLQGDAGLKTVRSSRNKIMDVTRPFTLLPDADGKTIRVIPIAGIVTEEVELYSNYEEDKAHSIYLIGDSTAPLIGGMEVFETDLFAGGSPVTVTLTASDTGSGVGSFYAVLTNTDNLVTKTFTSTDNSTLSLELAEDSLLLEGNVTVEVYAIDNVGNENKQNGSITGFSLEASVERMLEPHDPIFQCGETGILTIVTKGYAERVTVEFPAAMSALDAELDTTFDYTGDRQYRQEEKLEFMVPLYTPENENYVITVRAYKGERELVAHPDLCTIEVKGSILNEVRTRLR